MLFTSQLRASPVFPSFIPFSLSRHDIITHSSYYRYRVKQSTKKTRE